MSIENLIDAVKAGDEPRVRRMLQENRALADARLPNGESPLMAAVYRAHMDVVNMLLQAGADVDVFAAAALGRLPDLEAALRDKAVVARRAYDGWTPLHLAAFFGRLPAAERLIGAGAPLDAVSSNSMRNTPLHAAVAGGHSDVALLLISRGAGVTARDAGGHTPLHIAAENGLLDVVKALLARGADPLAVDGDDRTPLARAAAKNRNDVIDELNNPRR